MFADPNVEGAGSSSQRIGHHRATIWSVATNDVAQIDANHITPLREPLNLVAASRVRIPSRLIDLRWPRISRSVSDRDMDSTHRLTFRIDDRTGQTSICPHFER